MKRLIFALALTFLFNPVLFGRTVSVAPTGEITSLRQAVETVRTMPRGEEPIIVEFQAGVYPMSEPVVFKPEDSGTEKAPVVYRAAPGAEVVFSAGRRIDGWEKSADGVWTACLPEVAAGNWYFEQLYVDNHWATRCREPNALYHYTEEKVDYAVDPATGKPEPMERRAFIASLKDIEPLRRVPNGLRSKDMSNTRDFRLTDVSFTLYNSWESAKLRLAAVDFDTRMVLFTGPSGAELMHWEPRQRYHIENFKEALDQPGEWFLDRDGTLSYIPLPGQDMESIDVYAPVSGAFLIFDGEILKDKPEGRIANIRFEGLRFRHSGWTLPPEGDRGGQAALSVPFSTRLDGCRNIVFERCEWGLLGGAAVRFNQSCTDCRFERNYVHDLGAGGVYVGIGHQANWEQLEATERNTVANCVIRDGGKVALGGIGVWIGHGSHNEVLHNDISEFFYTGVSVGWQWGYQPTRSQHNRIEFNRIHHLGGWVLSDMGGVYTLGVSPGTTVSNNVIHDVYAYSYGGWGLYPDEGSSGIRLENNLVYRTKTGLFHQHYGRDNLVRNNIFAYSLTDQLQNSRVEDHLSFTFENNIVLWEEGALFGHPWTKDIAKFWDREKTVLRNNVYWNPGGDLSHVFPGGIDLKTWQERFGQDEGSLVADPKFADPKNADFTLPDDSPVFKTGFKRFDYSKAGVYGEPEWVALAASFPHPVRPLPPEKPQPIPIRVNDDFEFPRSTPLPKATISDEGKKLVRIVTDRPAQGEKCLEIADADDLTASFNPHVVFAPNYETGIVQAAFDLRVRANAKPFIEFRDNASPYKVGPTMRVENGKLHVDGIPAIDFPVEEWVRIEIVVGTGKNATGEWTLRLRFPDGKESTHTPKTRNPDWKTLNWYGFCNLATTGEDASFFLDRMELRCHE